MGKHLLKSLKLNAKHRLKLKFEVSSCYVPDHGIPEAFSEIVAYAGTDPTMQITYEQCELKKHENTKILLEILSKYLSQFQTF